MYKVIYQKLESIEIGLDGDLTRDEFVQVIHQLESLCTTHPGLKVLFDLTNLESYDFKIAIEEYEFYKSYKDRVERIAIVSDRRAAKFLGRIFDKFLDLKVNTYAVDEVEAARAWIFPSKLP